MNQKRVIIIAITVIAVVTISVVAWHLSKRDLLGPGEDGRTVLTNEMIRIAQELEQMEELQSGYPPPLTNLTENKNEE